MKEPGLTIPYEYRPLGHLSASAIKDASRCEAMFAFTRIYKGVPKLPEPVSPIAGTTYHWLIERFSSYLWKKVLQNKKPIERDEHSNYVQFGVGHMSNVLDRICGPRKEPITTEPPILWRADRNREALTEFQYLERVRDEKSKYL